jgi:hypothetical protein
MAGDFPVIIDVKYERRYKIVASLGYTLGYVGYLYGDPNPFITVWLMFAGTEPASPLTSQFLFLRILP